MITQSRIDFEQWAGPRGYDTRRWYVGYYDKNTQLLWVGWSARDSEILELSARLVRAEEAL